MNKILPFIFVVTFWGLFYLGNNHPQLGETIAFVAIVSILLFLMYRLKTYLLKKTNK